MSASYLNALSDFYGGHLGEAKNHIIDMAVEDAEVDSIFENCLQNSSAIPSSTYVDDNTKIEGL